MSTRVIRTAAALRPAGEWEQAIPLQIGRAHV